MNLKFQELTVISAVLMTEWENENISKNDEKIKKTKKEKKKIKKTEKNEKDIKKTKENEKERQLKGEVETKKKIKKKKIKCDNLMTCLKTLH